MNIIISIIVPTYKRIEKLKNCINALLGQDYPQEHFEIIVVDDASDCRVEQLISDFAKEFTQVRYFSQHHRGPAAARNLGIHQARGRLIGFVDDDCICRRDWAGKMVTAHGNNPGIAAIGGDTLPAQQRSYVMVGQFLSTCSIEVKIGQGMQAIFFPTCNVSFKKEVFEQARFNEHFPFPGGEDLEFFWRLFKNGKRFLWDQDIIVVHDRDETFFSFIRQAYIYGRGNFLVQYLHRDHPLLKELDPGTFSFWRATAFNILKIPRFVYILARKLICKEQIKNINKKLSMYICLSIHKAVYILGNIAEYLRVKKNKTITPQLLPPPQLLILDITHRCNLSCRICDIWKTAKEESDLELRYVKKVLREARRLGIKEITLSGGEPLLRKDIPEIFDHARHLGLKKIGVLSNGLAVKEMFSRLEPYLTDETISLIISLDSITPRIHNYMRNSPCAWEHTVESLRLLAALKSRRAQVRFNVISIICGANLKELPQLIPFLYELKVNSLQFQALLPNNLRMADRRQSPFWVTPDQLPLLDKTVDLLIQTKKRYKDFICNSEENLLLMKKYYRRQLRGTDVRCKSAQKTMLIANEGKSATCFSFYGDIKKQSLRDILDGAARIHAYNQAARCPWPCLLPCFCDPRKTSGEIKVECIV
ncbi:MAG: glycosyltransferase [Candidatus Omnitrophica bacterium]|nr:glycosyltransferase [Candidatus Omnitrophota bacterium]